MKRLKYVIKGSLILLTASTVFMGGCPSPVEDLTPQEDEYLLDEDIEEEHSVGTTNCPQNLADLTIYEAGSRGGLESIDSADFNCEHQAIDVYCNGEKTSTSCSFDNTNENKLTVEFNCGQTTDVNAEVTCNLYKDNTLKESKKIKVNLTVK